MSNYDNTNRFGLFKNKKMREGKQDANLQGTLNVDGKEYWINGWTNEKNGEKYISGTIRAKEGQQPQAASGAAEDDFDDKIPF